MTKIDSIHERARLLAADSIDGQLSPRDAGWLAEHVAGCQECREAADDFAVIRAELKALAAPLPPRDLWARTSARLDEIDRSRARSRAGLPRFAFSASLLGTAVAVGAVVVMVGVSIASLPGTAVPAPAGSEAAFATKTATPTQGGQTNNPPLVAQQITTVGDNGVVYSYDALTHRLVQKQATCDASGKDCTVGSGGTTVAKIDVPGPVDGVTIDANTTRVAVWTSTGISVMSIGKGGPTPTPTPTPTATSTASHTAQATPTPVLQTASIAPTLPSSPTSTPAATASAAQPQSILNGFVPVGDPAFSPDSVWLAFAAKPKDGSAGADVFVWHVGDPQARQITTSHRASFSGWLGQTDRLLISESVKPEAVPAASPSDTPTPTGSAQPTATDASTPSASSSVAPVASPAASPSASPTATIPAGGTPLVAVAYILDPATCTADVFDRSMLDPSIDPKGTRIVYRSAVPYADASGNALLASADIYYDRVANLKTHRATICNPGGQSSASSPLPQPTDQAAASPSDAAATPLPAPSATPSAVPSQAPTGSQVPTASPAGSASPGADASPSASPAPTYPQALPVTDPGEAIGDWVVRWDPSGLRFAVWFGDAGAKSGELELFAIDETGERVATSDQLFAAPATRQFQIEATKVTFTSPSDVGDGKVHIKVLPSLPDQPDPSPTPFATQAPADESARPGH